MASSTFRLVNRRTQMITISIRKDSAVAEVKLGANATSAAYSASDLTEYTETLIARGHLTKIPA